MYQLPTPQLPHGSRDPAPAHYPAEHQQSERNRSPSPPQASAGWSSTLLKLSNIFPWIKPTPYPHLPLGLIFLTHSTAHSQSLQLQGPGAEAPSETAQEGIAHCALRREWPWPLWGWGTGPGENKACCVPATFPLPWELLKGGSVLSWGGAASTNCPRSGSSRVGAAARTPLAFVPHLPMAPRPQASPPLPPDLFVPQKGRTTALHTPNPFNIRTRWPCPQDPVSWQGPG